MVYQVPLPGATALANRANRETRTLTRWRNTGSPDVKLCETYMRHPGPSPQASDDYPVRGERYIMNPSRYPRFDQPQDAQYPALQ